MADVEKLIERLRDRGTSAGNPFLRDEAADLLASYHSLAQAAGFTGDVGEALKAIPVKDAALSHSRGAISGLPEGAFGYSEPRHDDDPVWPLQAELLHIIDAALATPSPPIIDEED